MGYTRRVRTLSEREIRACFVNATDAELQRLRDGVVQTTNALEVLRRAGVEVR